MRIYKYSEFVFEKRLGVSEETLKYSDILMKYVKEKFQDFYSSKEVMDFEEKLEFEDEISKAITDEFPISKVELTITFNRISNEEFATKFPTISSRGKNFTTTGYCEDFEETEDKLVLKMGVGGIINKDRFDDIDGLETELESGMLHELNHSFEGYNRYIDESPVIPTSITYALDINAADVPENVWEIWWKEFAYYIYWTERHELNAMTQDALPYTKKYSFDEMKKKAPSWDFYERMVLFDPKIFKQRLVDEIKKTMPEKDPELVLTDMKNGLSDSLKKLIEDGDNGPDTSIDPDLIKKLSVDDFLSYCDKRIKKGAEKLKRGVSRHYTR